MSLTDEKLREIEIRIPGNCDGYCCAEKDIRDLLDEVKRLREREASLLKEGQSVADLACLVSKGNEELRDAVEMKDTEIARLREGLEKIADFFTGCATPESSVVCDNRCMDIAREYLAPPTPPKA